MYKSKNAKILSIKMSEIKKNSARSVSRLSVATKIDDNDIVALISYRRCARKFSVRCCHCIKDGRCFNCVRFGMKKDCNAKLPRTDRLLKTKRAELDTALVEIARTSSRAARLQKEIRQLETKSSRELDRLMEEIENESGGGEEASDPGEGSSGGVSSSTERPEEGNS